jgi:hypothetical protein
MCILVNHSDLKINTNYRPDCDTREIYPDDAEDVRKDKKKFPFILNNAVVIDGIYFDENKEAFHFTFSIKERYTWDGATIPRLLWFIIGAKGSPEFLIASMLHDVVCQNKYMLNGNRYLSSLILRETLLSCGTPKWKADVMFFSVDLWQRTQGWEKYVKVNKQ